MMVSIEYLKELLPLLKGNGCRAFKVEGLELSFAGLETQSTEAQAPLVQTKASSIDSPPDFKADDLFNHDKILHWSGSGDQEPLPLTGEGEALAAP